MELIFTVIGVTIVGFLMYGGFVLHGNAIKRIMKTPYDELTYSEQFQKHERTKARENGTPEFDPMILAILLIVGIPALPLLLFLL